MSATTDAPAADTRALPESEPRPAVERLPPWNVVLLDDQEHTYDYVVSMMRRLFGMGEAAAFRVARAVDTTGRAVCFTTHREHAELKRDQVRAFGPDPRIASSRGGMKAVIEPADGAC